MSKEVQDIDTLAKRVDGVDVKYIYLVGMTQYGSLRLQKVGVSRRTRRTFHIDGKRVWNLLGGTRHYVPSRITLSDERLQLTLEEALDRAQYLVKVMRASLMLKILTMKKYTKGIEKLREEGEPDECSDD